MIKSEIRSTVKNSLQKYDKTARYHDRVLDAVIEKTLNELYTEVFIANPLTLQRYTKGYGYTTPLIIMYEAVTGIYYTILPENIVPFNDKASGVRRIAPATQIGTSFFPMDQREWDLATKGVQSSKVKDGIGYIVNFARVEYYGITSNIITSGVRMDLIIPFSEYGDANVVLIPEHLDDGKRGFIDRVVARLVTIPPVDLKDDNKEKEQ